MNLCSDVSEMCDTCAQIKPDPGLGKSPLHQLKVNKRFQVCAIGIMSPLPCTDTGNELLQIIFQNSLSRLHYRITPRLQGLTEFICRYGAKYIATWVVNLCRTYLQKLVSLNLVFISQNFFDCFSVTVSGSRGQMAYFCCCSDWKASIKPRLLFSRAGYASWGLSISSV